MFVGINIGSISVKFVNISKNGEIIASKIIPHQGQPGKIIAELTDKGENDFYGISGYQGHISEAEAIERVLKESETNYDVIISLGGEAFAVYLLRENRILNVLSHNRCAAGSGEFLIQQIGRLNLSLDQAIDQAKTGKSIKIASRCSVHCKSDITHKLNRQEAEVNDILYSIHESMVMKVSSLLEKSKHPHQSVLVIGGLSENSVMIDLLKKSLNGLKISVLAESSFYEAYGTALLVLDNPKFRKPQLSINPLFNTLGSLKNSDHLVRQIDKYPIITEEGDKPQLIVMGIDGGSTTTKITLLEFPTRKLLASHYTRTNGDPLNATKECIREIKKQYGNNRIDLISTTGSAREIIAALIGTSAVYNEISAHTAGAVSFDSEVDTIFEIGGQDAKYIYLENGSPIDYAMNAACSAGTGSFLEECAKGDLGISVYDISDIALQAESPVLFKADCAAFINSDIRTALQEGYTRENIVGGLVSSIVNNYLTKVKGPRKVGKKIFLQGGVAKNNAIAFAFAQSTGKEIIIPPNPELTGAYGVALMAYQRHLKGTVDVNPTSPEILLGYEMQKLNSFTCHSCDNYCSINRYQVGDRRFPFGGKCSKYESRWKQIEKDDDVPDFVEERNKLIFSVLDEEIHGGGHPIELLIGIPRALTTHFLLPLYYTFLKSLGFQVVISGIDSDGELTVNAPFCFPTQIAHGAVLDLVRGEEPIDYIFFPQVQRMPHQGVANSYLCPITQASPFILKKAFSSVEFLSPSVDFSNGYENDNEMISYFEKKFNFPLQKLQDAYTTAIAKQHSIEGEMMKLGKKALELAIDQDKPAVLLVGRSYNAFPNETSQSMGRKLASKGTITIPYDCLGSGKSSSTAWYFSNLILDAVELAKKHDNLFILYISNFGCSIDSFTQEYLRREMNSKPYLKLEIDSHSADAGTQTRLEAFLDIIQNYDKKRIQQGEKFILSKIIRDNDEFWVQTSRNERLNLKDKRVSIHFPIFSKYHGEALPLAFRWMGYNVPEPIELSEDQLNVGLQYSSGAECLPFPIHIGQINEIWRNKRDDEVIGFYVIPGGAPCIIASYVDILNKYLQDNQIDDVFIFAPYKDNDFLGLHRISLFKYLPLVTTFSDLMIEIHSVLTVVGDENAVSHFYEFFSDFIKKATSFKLFNKYLESFIDQISSIAIIKNPKNCPKVLVTGDFFVRFDPFFFKGLTEKYSEKDVILLPVGLSEALIYPGYDDLLIASKKIKSPVDKKLTFLRAVAVCRSEVGRMYIESWLSVKVLERAERKIRSKFNRLGILSNKVNDIRSVISNASTHIDPSIYGEAILTVGKTAEAMADDYQGVIILGPFSCLPFRISEAILKPLCLENDFPFLSYETDGRSIPPAFLRLVDVHVQQVLRKWYEFKEGVKYPVFAMVSAEEMKFDR